MRTAVAAALLAVTALLAAGTANAASFDCGRARTPDERAICADRRLNDQDVRMATWLDALGQLQLMGANGAMHDDQREWLAGRRRCGGDRACLARAYDARLTRLTSDYAAWARRFR